MCLYKATIAKNDDATLKQKAKLASQMEKSQDENTVNYLKEMKEIREKLNVDENFSKKFGYLKKAAVLAYYGRGKDAKIEVAKAAEVV